MIQIRHVKIICGSTIIFAFGIFFGGVGETVPLSQTISSAIPNTRQQDMVRPERDLYPSSADPAGMKRSGFLGIDENDNAPVWKAEFYEGLRQQSMGNMSTAQVHFDNAVDAGFLDNIGDNAEFFSYLFAINELIDAAPHHTHFISTSTIINNQQSQIDNLQAVGRKVLEYKQAGTKQNASLRDRINYSTWQILFAEYATLNPEFGQYNNARWAFKHGDEALQAIQQELADAPDDLEELAKTKPGRLAIAKFDAISVRKAAIAKRIELNWNQERRRVHQLQEIANTYRKLAEELILSNTYQNSGNSSRALDNLTGVMQSIVAIRERSKPDELIFEDNPPARDFYLFHEEIPLDTINNPTDYEIINMSPNVFSNDSVGHIKGLAAFAFYTQALKTAGLLEKLELLKNAKQYSSAALDANKIIEGVPQGTDKDSILAIYTLALVHLETAKSNISKNFSSMAIRENSKADISNAKELINRLLDLPEIETLPTVFSHLKDLQAQLSGDQHFISSAIENIANSDLAQAMQNLNLGLALHSSTDLWTNRLDVARRLNLQTLPQLLEEFDNAIENTLISGASAEVIISRSLAMIKVLTTQYALAIEKNQNVEAASLESFSEYRNFISDQLPDFKNKQNTLAQLQACFTSFIAMETLVSQEMVTLDIQETAYAAGLIALKQLELQKLGLLRVQNDESWQTKECLVHLLRSIGHLGVNLLDDYQDDSIAHFLYAYEVESTLPFLTTPSAQHGTPLLQLVQNRDSDADATLAFEERRTRHLISGFLDAAYLSAFGNQDSAKQAATQALTNYSKKNVSGDSGQLYRAEDYSNEVDGFDKNITLFDTVRCYMVLSAISNADNLEALQYAAAIVGLPTDISDESLAMLDLPQVTADIQSPIVAFAFGRALEEYALTMEIEKLEIRNRFFSSASSSYHRGNELLNTQKIKDKYAYMSQVFAEGLVRLDSPEIAVAQYMASDSVQIENLEDDLKRHPQNESLWRVYLENKIAKAHELNDSEIYASLIKDLRLQGDKLPPFTFALYLGKAHEGLGKLLEAKSFYELGEKNAQKPEQLAIIKSAIGNIDRKLATGSQN